MLRVEYEAREAFIAETEQAGNWEAIKKKYLQPHYQGGEQLPVKSQTQTLKALVQYRDLIDFRLYRKAVEAIFPLEAYNLTSRVNGHIEGSKFTSSWYEFVVTLRALPVEQGKTTQCVIKVNAPGSRNLTSDIDTSLKTHLSTDNVSFLQFAHLNIKNKGPDYEGRITNALIDGFYMLSEQEFGLTSGEHRDSNAYVDLSANEEDHYPKFKDDDVSNPTIGGEKLFNPAELEKKLAECKLKKHRLELAASMFSLRVALDEEGWAAFKQQVGESIKVCATYLDDGSEEVPKKQASYSRATHEDLAENFKQSLQDPEILGAFRQAEDFFKVYHEGLAAKKRELKPVEGKLDAEAQERNLEVAALNRLYFTHLEIMTDCNDAILKLKHENKDLHESLEPLKRKLEQEERKLQKFKKDPDFADDVPEQDRKCAALRQQYEAKVQRLKANILQEFDLEIKKLEARYQAHTFANEAYVCRSAVYHVVKGEQEGGKIEVNQQTLLGSVLQQTGFKLLHSQELLKRQKEQKNVGEAAYRTAKYGKRVHQLIFEKQNITDREISAQYKSKRLSLFPKLKSPMARTAALELFSLEDLLFLNVEAKIIAEIKSNAGISEVDKYAQTERLLGESGFRPQKLLEIASKVLAITYLSRFESKPGRELLWGGFSSNAQPLQLTYLLDKVKKESTQVVEPVAKRAKKEEPEEHELQSGARMTVRDTTFEDEIDWHNKNKGGNGGADSHLSGSTVKRKATLRNTNEQRAFP